MKKNPLRFVFLALAALSGGWLAWYGAVMLWAKKMGASTAILTQSEAASLGIIGGADGPTAIIVATSGPDWDLILVGAVFLLSLAGYLWMRRKSCR